MSPKRTQRIQDSPARRRIRKLHDALYASGKEWQELSIAEQWSPKGRLIKAHNQKFYADIIEEEYKRTLEVISRLKKVKPKSPLIPLLEHQLKDIMQKQHHAESIAKQTKHDAQQ